MNLTETIPDFDLIGTDNQQHMPSEYDDKEAVNIARKGYMFLTVPSGGTVGDTLFAVDATGVLDAGTAGAGETDYPGITLEETVAAGEIALIRIQL